MRVSRLVLGVAGCALLFALALAPASPPYACSNADKLVAADRLPEAVSAFREARENDGKCVDSGLARVARRHCERASRLLGQRLLARAREAYSEALEASPDMRCELRHVNRRLCRTARTVSREGLDQRAAELYAAVLDLRPAALCARRGLARVESAAR